MGRPARQPALVGDVDVGVDLDVVVDGDGDGDGLPGDYEPLLLDSGQVG